jgi:hypothetical protein
MELRFKKEEDTSKKYLLPGHSNFSIIPATGNTGTNGVILSHIFAQYVINFFLGFTQMTTG